LNVIFIKDKKVKKKIDDLYLMKCILSLHILLRCACLGTVGFCRKRHKDCDYRTTEEGMKDKRWEGN
jgi:hypothetical protein